jgi:toxin-antitoxin system PIN domain toxin
VRFLLDVNVLVALAFPEHTSHQKAHAWFRREPRLQWATCSLTQAGFLRVASRTLGGKRDCVGQALAGLERDCQSSGHEYWPDDVDLRGLSEPLRSRMIGPNEIADMQLVMLANRYRGQLATFDTGVRELVSGTRYANSILVL